jgi:hypothetical protein
MHTLSRVALVGAALAALVLSAPDGRTAGAQPVTCSESVVPRDAAARPIALTGTWTAEDGKYRLRQVGSCLWWVGNAGGSSVFAGSIFRSTVTGAWADVAARAGSTGKLTLTIDRTQRTLRRTAQSGSAYPAAIWTRGRG